MYWLQGWDIRATRIMPHPLGEGLGLQMGRGCYGVGGGSLLWRHWLHGGLHINLVSLFLVVPCLS